jgi:hypothetical protein
MPQSPSNPKPRVRPPIKLFRAPDAALRLRAIQIRRAFKRKMLEKFVRRRARVRRRQFPRFAVAVRVGRKFAELKIDFRLVVQFICRLPPQRRDGRFGRAPFAAFKFVLPFKISRSFRFDSPSSAGNSLSAFRFLLPLFHPPSSSSFAIRQRKCGNSPSISLWTLDFGLWTCANHKPSQSA